jgi:hypothetical protein
VSCIQVRQQTAVVGAGDGSISTWDPVKPVISSGVALITDASPAPQYGDVVTVVVTFVKEGSGEVSRVSVVTGFSSADVEVVAVASKIGGALQKLPVLVEVSRVAQIAYKVTIQPKKELWPPSILTDCTAITVTLEVPGAVHAPSLCNAHNASMQRNRLSWSHMCLHCYDLMMHQRDTMHLEHLYG